MSRRGPAKGAGATPTRTLPGWVPATTFGLSLAGLAVAIYLTIAEYTAASILACPANGTVNCERVLSSSSSKILGIPVSVLGLVFFVGMAALTWPPAWRAADRRIARLRLWASVAGIAFVLYLVYEELFAIGAICLWCTAVHLITFALFVIILLYPQPDHATRR